MVEGGAAGRGIALAAGWCTAYRNPGRPRLASTRQANSSPARRRGTQVDRRGWSVSRGGNDTHPGATE